MLFSVVPQQKRFRSLVDAARHALESPGSASTTAAAHASIAGARMRTDSARCAAGETQAPDTRRTATLNTAASTGRPVRGRVPPRRFIAEPGRSDNEPAPFGSDRTNGTVGGPHKRSEDRPHRDGNAATAPTGRAARARRQQKRAPSRLYAAVPVTPSSLSVSGASSPSSSASDVNSVDEYFSTRDTVRTSDRTLSQLNLTRLDSETVERTLRELPDRFAAARESLSRAHRLQYHRWAFELLNGFNLLFVGYGSKRRLLLDFVQSCFPHWPQVVVNGFFPALSIKEVGSGGGGAPHVRST